MNTINYFSMGRLLLSACLIFSFTSAVEAQPSSLASDNARVISLVVSDLPDIKDKAMEGYSLSAMKDGRLEPIPFQFDERTESGYVYMKDHTDKRKSKDPIVGIEGVFDQNDELIFMLKDAGKKKGKGVRADGQIVSEIAVDAYNGKNKYVYLVKDGLLESDEFYVRYSAELGRVSTDFYELEVDPKNAFLWKDFYFPSFTGKNPGKPIDTIKLRMRSNAFGSVPITVNNKHMVAKAVAHKSGPIRSTTDYKVILTYLKTPLVNLKLQILHHEQEISYDSRISIPKIRRRLVSKPSMKMSIDGNELQGAILYSSNGPKEAAVVDGAISDIEQQLIDAPLKASDENWYFLDTKDNMMLYVDYSVDGDEEVPLAMMYEDIETNKKIKPEYFAGQLPNVGFEITKIPLRGSLKIAVDIHMFSSGLDGNISELSATMQREPKISVRSL